MVLCEVITHRQTNETGFAAAIPRVLA